MPAPSGHKHCSERESPPWICCVPSSGVMFARHVKDLGIPVKIEEVHKLRIACGASHPATCSATSPCGVSNSQLITGLRRRYGIRGLVTGTSFSDFWAAFDPGMVACFTGKMGAFPAGHRLRRFDPDFVGFHKCFGFRFNGNDVAWWDNPLAPRGIGYLGEKVTKDELRIYIKAAIAAGGAWIVGEKLVTATLEPVLAPTLEPVLGPVLEPILEPVFEPTIEPIILPGRDLPVPGREVPRERHVAPTPLTGPMRPI